MTQIQTYKKIDFIESIVYRSLLSNDGKNLSIWCPFCKHENKSKLKLAIHLEKDLFHCWLCGKKGSDISYLINKKQILFSIEFLLTCSIRMIIKSFIK